MMGTKGMRVSIGMVLFILFVVVYIELRQTILMPGRVSVSDFISKVHHHGVYHKLKEYRPPAFSEDNSFADVLKEYADSNNSLSVAVVNKNYVSMALNFLKTSAWHLASRGRSVLLISTDKEAHKMLLDKGVHNFYFKDTPTLAFKNQTGFSEGHDFGSKNYFVQSNMKTWIVLKILELGYSVLMSDTDVLVFRDPYPYYSCVNCDLHTQKDRVQFNTGFTYIKPTNLSKLLYQTAWNLYAKYHKSHDQIYVSMALQSLKNLNITPEIQYMSPKQFMCGLYYYEQGNRMFVGEPCKDCVMVHNNYMGSLAGKIYRFKENLQWYVDDDEYYTSKSRNYLSYANPFFFGDATGRFEKKALFSALKVAHATNRTLILPEFHCCDCVKEKCETPYVKCSLLDVIRVKTFDSVYGGQYREHMFLHNLLVPQGLRHTKAKNLAVLTDIVKAREKNVSENAAYTLFPFQADKRIDFSAFIQWVSSFHNRIIHFHSMYDVLDSDEKSPAFECAAYEQWDAKISV